MLQIADNSISQLVQSQNSYNSLTSLEGLYYKNTLEMDFEDEELSSEYRTLDYVVGLKKTKKNNFETVPKGHHAIVKKVQHLITMKFSPQKLQESTMKRFR